MLTQAQTTELESALDYFSGTENWWKHWAGRITYTDGVKYLAEKAGAFWLIDLIASHQNRRLRDEKFQVWTLTVDRSKNPMAVAECRPDRDEPVIARQKIEFTDFPLPSIKLWLVDKVLLLPSEY